MNVTLCSGLTKVLLHIQASINRNSDKTKFIMRFFFLLLILKHLTAEYFRLSGTWTHRAGLTRAGKSVLEDVVAADIAPGSLPAGPEAVALPGLLFHSGVPLPRGEDGPHIWRSEALLPAPRRRSRLGVSPLRWLYLQVSSVTGRRRGRVSSDGSHHHCALVGLGKPHFGFGNSLTWSGTLFTLTRQTSTLSGTQREESRALRLAGARATTNEVRTYTELYG